MPLSLLATIRVLDLSQYLPGPLAAQMLADLGASVIKVEPPEGDPVRRFDLPDSDGLPASYKLINAGKRVVKLDLKSDEGRLAFEQLLARADVLIESFRPGILERLGLGRDRLAELYPGLVHVALSGWGQDGPYRLRAGFDLSYVAVGGGLIASGTPEKPIMACPPMADHAGAQQAALAAVAGLFGRMRTGRGGYFDISLMESVLAWQSIPLTMAARGAPSVRSEGFINGGAAYYNVYRTADDRFVSLAAIGPRFWDAFCRGVGRPNWVSRQTDPLPQRALQDELATLFAAHPARHWLDLLGPADCCLEEVVSFEALCDHPQVAARGQVTRTDGPEPIVEVLPNLRLDGAPPPERVPLTEVDVATALAAWQEPL